MTFQAPWQIEAELADLRKRYETANQIIAQQNRLLAKIIGPMQPRDAEVVILSFGGDQ